MKGRGPNKENDLQLRFPAVVKKKFNIFNTTSAETTAETISEITGPCTIMDIHGRILVWSLPEVLSDDIQVRIIN
jgi:hypothetical protein